jgi:protein-disulfide isomerase
MHDRIFRDQAEWQDTRKPEPLFLEMFRDMGLDAGAYESCRGDDEVEDLVKDLRKRARESGIRATPAFLVNGNLVFGAFSLEQFREVLEEHGPTP